MEDVFKDLEEGRRVLVVGNSIKQLKKYIGRLKRDIPDRVVYTEARMRFVHDNAASIWFWSADNDCDELSGLSIQSAYFLPNWHDGALDSHKTVLRVTSTLRSHYFTDLKMIYKVEE